MFGIDHVVTAKSGQCFVTKCYRLIRSDMIELHFIGELLHSTNRARFAVVCSLVTTKVHRLRQPDPYDRSPWYPDTVPNFICSIFNNISIWIGVIQPLLALRDRWLRHPCVCTLIVNGRKTIRIVVVVRFCYVGKWSESWSANSLLL